MAQLGFTDYHKSILCIAFAITKNRPAHTKRGGLILARNYFIS